MILCIIEAAAAVIWLIFGIRKGMEGSSRMAPKILLVTAVLGIFLAVRAQNTHVINDEDQIARKNPGQGQRTETLEVSVPELGQKEEYTAVISERQLTAAEKEEVFERAKEEAEQIFIGKNDSVDAVRDTVVLPATLADGLVEAEWSFDNYEVMQTDGSIIEDAVPEDGVEVQAKLQMTCQESGQFYSFYFKVLPQKLTETEQLKKQLGLAVEHADAETAAQKFISLPQKVDGHAVAWKEKRSNDAVNFAFLGIIAAAAFVMKEKETQKKERELRERQLLLGYPEMISKLTLLLGAGMSVTLAWEKVAYTYKKQRGQHLTEKNPVYEEMLIACYEMQDGVSERNAYLRFGERCGLTQYRKMVSIITQNIRKGQQELTKLLEDEAGEAYALRREFARKAGEEAGTKLLLPMMLMLMLVMAVILVPACISFQL